MLINVNGRKVSVDEGFAKLSPEEQSNAVDEIAASFKAPEPVNNPPKFGLGDTWPARLAKSVYSAVTLPGDVMQGNVSMTGEDGRTNPEVINRSAELAAVGSPISPAARLGIGWAGALKTKDAPAPTEEMLGAASNTGYDAARNSAFELKAGAVSDWAKATKAKLEKDGRLERFAPDTHGVLNDLQNAPADAVATGGNLISAREALREASRNFQNPREKSAAESAIRELDSFINKPPEEAVLAGSAPDFAKLAEDARGNYAAKKRSELVSQALEYADQNAGAANSGANVGNAERAKLKQIYQNDRKSAGFSIDELAQTDRIVRGAPLANTTRAIGNLLGGGGGLGALHAAITGGTAGFATGGPFGAAIGLTTPVVGYGLKKISDNLGQKEITRLQEMIRGRSPLAEGMPSRAVDDVSAKQARALAMILMGLPSVPNGRP